MKHLGTFLWSLYQLDQVLHYIHYPVIKGDMVNAGNILKRKSRQSSHEITGPECAVVEERSYFSSRDGA